jgi:hypothetical protein
MLFPIISEAYIFIHTSLYIHLYTYIYTEIHTQTWYICISTYFYRKYWHRYSIIPYYFTLIYIYTYICIHTSSYMHPHKDTNRSDICVYIHIFTVKIGTGIVLFPIISHYLYTYIYIYICICIYMCVFIHVNTYVYTHIWFIYTYIYKFTVKRGTGIV